MRLKKFTLQTAFILFASFCYAQTDSIVKLHLDTTICNHKIAIHDTIYSDRNGKSVIIANQVNNSGNFFIIKRKNNCWDVFSYDGLTQLTTGDSLAFLQLNDKGSKELVIFKTFSYGSNGAPGGSSESTTTLIIIDIDSEIVLFDHLISFGEERWENTYIENDESEEDSLTTFGEQLNCNSVLKIEGGKLIFVRTCNFSSTDNTLTQEDKNEFCDYCSSGTYVLKNNVFIKVK